MVHLVRFTCNHSCRSPSSPFVCLFCFVCLFLFVLFAVATIHFLEVHLFLCGLPHLKKSVCLFDQVGRGLEVAMLAGLPRFESTWLVFYPLVCNLVCLHKVYNGSV